MKPYSIALILAAVWLAAPAGAQNNVTKVSGKTSPRERVEFFVRNVVAQGRQDTPELRNMVKEELISRELLAQEAAGRGLDKTPDVAVQLDIARQEILMGSLMRDVVKGSAVSDEAVKKEYERLKGQLGSREYKARHILVEKEDEAKEIIAQIRKGASFEK